MKRTTDRRIDIVIEHALIATRIKPAFDQEIADDLAFCDSNQANETGISGQGMINDPVAAAVMARAHVLDRSNRVDNLVTMLESTVRELVTELNRGKRRTPAAQDEPLCSGGDPSTWGDTSCGDIVRSEQRGGHVWHHPSGLCPKPLKRKERYERTEAAA